jgi:hypothetical protein
MLHIYFKLSAYTPYFICRYKMIFVPFTGVDSHQSCVTFGAGLLFSETIESYKWLLSNFLQAHDNKQPLLTLTDQDASMRQAVESVFDRTIHRLCMWHITQKLPIKVYYLHLIHNTHIFFNYLI